MPSVICPACNASQEVHLHKGVQLAEMACASCGQVGLRRPATRPRRTVAGRRRERCVHCGRVGMEGSRLVRPTYEWVPELSRRLVECCPHPAGTLGCHTHEPVPSSANRYWGHAAFRARFGEPDGAWYPLSRDGDTSGWPWADWVFPDLDRSTAAALPCEVCEEIEKVHAGWHRGMELLAARNDCGAMVFRKCQRCSHTVLLVAAEFTDAQRATWARAVELCQGRRHSAAVHHGPCGQCLSEVATMPPRDR